MSCVQESTDNIKTSNGAFDTVSFGCKHTSEVLYQH